MRVDIAYIIRPYLYPLMPIFPHTAVGTSIHHPTSAVTHLWRGLTNNSGKRMRRTAQSSSVKLTAQSELMDARP